MTKKTKTAAAASRRNTSINQQKEEGNNNGDPCSLRNLSTKKTRPPLTAIHRNPSINQQKEQNNTGVQFSQVAEKEDSSNELEVSANQTLFMHTARFSLNRIFAFA